MMLWVILTLMVTAASLFLAAPFLRGIDTLTAGDGADAATVYRDQLAEVEREAADGTIDAAQAETAKTEIKRRVLAHQRVGDGPIRRLAQVERKFFGGAIAGAVALGATLLYAFNGSPDIPAASRTATTMQQQPNAVAVGAPVAAGIAVPGAVPVPGAQPAAGLASVDDMIDRLAQRMAKSPGDADGWRMLGWSYFRVDRFQEAAGAYAKASALQPGVGPLKTAWAEALIRAADGKVTPEALQITEDALKLDAKDARARYFLGLAKEQAGDAKAALDLWLALLGDATAADDWESEVRTQTLELAKASGIDITARLPKSPTGPGILGKLNQDGAAAAANVPPAAPVAAPPAAIAAAPAPERGPSAADVKAAEGLSATDRDAMIRGMVDGLQARLDASPRDAEGWIKLVRSRAVMGDGDKAKAALAKAAQIFADAPAERDRIVAAAREAGVTQ